MAEPSRPRMSAPPSQDTAPRKKGRGRWFKVRVVLAVLVLVIGFTLYLNWRNSLPPSQISLLSQGRIYLDAPLMTLYTFPSLTVDGFHVQTNVTFSPSTTFAFAWANVTGGDLPVLFVLTDGGPFQGDASGGFTFRPTGFGAQSDFAAVRPGSSGVVLVRWAMDYTVRLMAQHAWFSDVRWVEVDYTLDAWGWFTGNLPAGNVSAPSSADLVPVGPPVRFTYGPGYVWSYGVSVLDGPLPMRTFAYRLPAISIPAGSEGTLTAVLASSFHWGPGDDYRMRMGASDATNVSLQLYLDGRFGSLLAEPVP